MKKKLLLLTLVLSLSCCGCTLLNQNSSQSDTPQISQSESSSISSQGFVSNDEYLGYATTTYPIGNDILNNNQWYIQYPSGTDEGGMKQSSINENFANKYFSRADDYLRFSLDAQDKGKSPNGSSVRSELRSQVTKYYFSGVDKVNNTTHVGNKADFRYTFKVNCTQPDIARFTVGQFEMFSGYDNVSQANVPDKPLIMIMFQGGELFAAIKYYTRSYENGYYEQLAPQDTISLGYVEKMEDISIRIVLDDRKVDIYRDGKHMIDTSFKSDQDSAYGVYFKLGLYYQTKQTDERIDYLFTDVYVKDVSLTVE